MPPSKIKTHPQYDDRMMQVLLRLQTRDADVDVREILTCWENTEPFHATTNKRSPSKIAQNLLVDNELCNTSKNSARSVRVPAGQIRHGEPKFY
jgi:hypothetical protein